MSGFCGIIDSEKTEVGRFTKCRYIIFKSNLPCLFLSDRTRVVL